MSLQRPFFIIIIFLILFISSFVFYINKAFLYSPETTHYNLTKEIIKLYNLTYDPDITSRQTELILRGSIDEDTLPRPAFHLYDPIYNRAPFGVYTAKQWALDSSIQSSAIQKFASLLFNIFGQGKFEYHGDYSWPASVNYFADGDKDKAYYGLGHILHLIEDMTVPAHSRNDHHVMGDPYEQWANDNNETINFNIAGPLYNKGYRPVYIYSSSQAFDELARYSNNYFFSKDSILSSDYIRPQIIEIRKEDLPFIGEKTYGYGMDENGKLFRLVIINYIPDWQNKIFGISNEPSYEINNDTKLNTDYWIHLAPKAVIYGAGVIKLFIDEAKYQAQLTKNEPKLNWWQKAQIFIQDLFGIGDGGEEQVAEPVIPSQPWPQPKPIKFPDGGPAIQPPEKPLENPIETPLMGQGDKEQPGEQGEVKGESAEKEEDKGGAVVVTGPKTGGGGGASRPDTQEPTQPPTSTEPPPTEPEDTIPPDVLIKSLTYNYASSSLIIEWFSSEVPSVSFDVEYKQENEEWQPLLKDTFETQASLSILRDVLYSFRVRAKDLAGNYSDWQEKSILVSSGPSSITDLSIIYSNNNFVTLQWTAPYPENSLSSLSYDIRYANTPIDNDNWESAKPISDFAFSESIPKAGPPGTTQTIDITPLKFNTIYYFAIKTIEGTKDSDVSNLVEYSTGNPPTLAKSIWPTFQKNQQHTGFISNSGPGFLSSESVKIKWETGVEHAIYTPLVIDTDGTLYAGGENGLYAINSRNGEVKWFYDTYNYDLERGGVYYSPTLASDGTIYFCSFGGTYLYALTPSGKLKWKFRVGGPNDGGSTPVIGADGTVYITSREQAYVYAVNPDGTKRWEYLITGATLLSSPAQGSDGTIYVAWRNYGLVGYITALGTDGDLRWQSEDINPDPYSGLSIDAKDNIYVVSNYNSGRSYLKSLKPADGTLNWSFPLWSNLNVLANIDENENIYIATEDGNIFFLNADGTSNKAIYIENEVLRPLIIDVDGIIYLVSGKKIIAFYPDGTEKWSHEFTEDITASPIMDETGTIYVSTRDGKIWVIGE